MIYRVEEFIENNINPITNCEYDSLWLALILTSDIDTPMIVGANNGCAYTIKINKQLQDDWRMAVGDFIEYFLVADLMGISQSYISRLEKRIIDKIRHYVNEEIKLF